jgi:hypothetical protein
MSRADATQLSGTVFRACPAGHAEWPTGAESLSRCSDPPDNPPDNPPDKELEAAAGWVRR